METLQSTAPQHVRKVLLRHKAAYVESVGKTDMATLGAVAQQADGDGTVLRLIMGATETMPLRAPLTNMSSPTLDWTSCGSGAMGRTCK